VTTTNGPQAVDGELAKRTTKKFPVGVGSCVVPTPAGAVRSSCPALYSMRRSVVRSITILYGVELKVAADEAIQAVDPFGRCARRTSRYPLTCARTGSADGAPYHVAGTVPVCGPPGWRSPALSRSRWRRATLVLPPSARPWRCAGPWRCVVVKWEHSVTPLGGPTDWIYRGSSSTTS
jgi:hypothetical protein